MEKNPSPHATQRRLKKSLNVWQKERAQAVEACINRQFLSPQGRISDLLGLVGDGTLTPQKRAGMLLFIVRGTYPLKHEFEPVVHLLQQNSVETAIARAFTWLPRASKTVLPLVSTGDVADVTRYSHAPRLSGIPRVVRNLVFSEPFADVDLAIWEDGVLGIGCRAQAGRIALDKRHWKNPRPFNRLLPAFYFAVARTIGRTATGLRALGFIARYLAPLAQRFVRRSQQPRFSLLISGGTYFVVEVPDATISNRLGVWKQVVPEFQLRVLVHDILPITHPQFFTETSNREHLEFVRLLTLSTEAFVGTPLLREELRAAMRIFSPKAPVITKIAIPVHMPEPGSFSRRTHFGKPYFVFFGGFEPRKGLAELVSLIEAAPDKEINFRIIVLGIPQPDHPTSSWETAHRILDRPDVFQLFGPISDADLSALISGAKATLYLSHAEGYGLPLLESALLGTVVLCRPTPTNIYFAEKYGGIWAGFDEINPNLIDLLNDLALAPPDTNVLGVGNSHQSNLPTSFFEWATRLRGGLSEPKDPADVTNVGDFPSGLFDVSAVEGL